jgi:Tfp pilus assembly protein PilV
MRPPEKRCSLRREAKRAKGKGPDERGFTLLEVTIALVLMMVVALGAASLFSYAVYNNSSGADRAQALAIAQQSLESLRNAKFSASGTDAVLVEGTRPTQTVYRGAGNGFQGRAYRLDVTITDTSATLKTITIRVTPQGAGQPWAGGGVTFITQRSISNE